MFTWRYLAYEYEASHADKYILLPLETVIVELEDAGVLRDGALDVFWSSFWQLGFYFDGDFEPRVG